jgi:hypothetical protein
MGGPHWAGGGWWCEEGWFRKRRAGEEGTLWGIDSVGAWGSMVCATGYHRVCGRRGAARISGIDGRELGHLPFSPGWGYLEDSK